jgi:TPR repeat protein
MEETTDFSDLSYDCRELWMVTQDNTAPMGDRDEAAAQLISKAEGGDSSVQYLVGRLYQDGPVLIPDSVEAQYWFDQSARQGHVPAQYALGKLYLSDDTEVCDPVLGVQWLEVCHPPRKRLRLLPSGQGVSQRRDRGEGHHQSCGVPHAVR